MWQKADVVSALRRQKQTECKLEVNLGYVASSRMDWTILQVAISKHKNPSQIKQVGQMEMQHNHQEAP